MIPNMKHTYSTILLSTLLCSGTVCAQAASSTWTICTRELELIETIVIEADEERIVTVDGFGIRRTRSLDSIFFAIPTPILHQQTDQTIEEQMVGPRDESYATKYIMLTDGQVMKGRITDSFDADKLAITLYTGTTIRSGAMIPLENILTIADSPIATSYELVAADDSITTRNNDVLRGFIESIGRTTSISVGRDVLEIPLDQISTINFANIPERIAGVYISTNDDLHLRVSSFDFDFQHPLTVDVDSVSLGLPSDARDVWLLDPSAPAGIELVHPSQRVISLCSIKPELTEPTGDRDWTPTPTAMSNEANPVLGTIDLHAPVRVVYPLPKGATRFACDLVAPINTWTDCIAKVYSISYAGQRTELLNKQLNADHPSQSLNVELNPDTAKIEIRIDPGAFGPIQDRVLLVHPRVLIES